MENLRPSEASWNKLCDGRVVAIGDPGWEKLLTLLVGRFSKSADDKPHFRGVILEWTSRGRRAACGTDAAVNSAQGIVEALRKAGVAVGDLTLLEIDDDGDITMASAVRSLDAEQRQQATQLVNRILALKSENDGAAHAWSARRERFARTERFEAKMRNRILDVAVAIAQQDDNNATRERVRKQFVLFLGRGGYRGTKGQRGSGMTAYTLATKLARAFKVVTVNEYFSSQKCPGCGHFLEKPAAFWNRKRTCSNEK